MEKGSYWTELNKERCIALEDQGLMTDAGQLAFEKVHPYQIVSTGSPMEEKIRQHNMDLRPEIYKRGYSVNVPKDKDGI